MTKVNKAQARKAFNNGQLVHVVPSKANPQSVWFRDCMIVISKLRTPDFDLIVQRFQYYNCNNQLGKRVAYYI
jgi:hypothetical protein